MSIGKFISISKGNAVKQTSRSMIFVSTGITATILCVAFFLTNKTETITASPTAADLPALNGESAIVHLKENGMYDSLSAALTAARYRVEAATGAATAMNRANKLQMNFTSSGLQLKSSAPDNNWVSNWRLASAGYGANQRAVTTGILQTVENRVELRRESQQLTEWFVNTPNGVEHGFTLAARPEAFSNNASLRLVMRLDGDLRARAEADGQALTLLKNGGTEKALRYEKLKVWDAEGNDLTARMQTEEGGAEVWLEVEDASAVYPLTIDPTFTQQQKLTADDGAAFDLFGSSVAISGETAIVGAFLDDIGSNAAQGSAYIFVRNGTTWTQQQKLVASDGAADDSFGTSVAISGETAIVGAYLATIGTNANQGSAYIFVRSGTTWMQQQKLVAADGATSDRFGTSVGISGETAIVGAETDDSSSNLDQGSAYVFVRSGTTWGQQQKLVASDGAASDGFGFSLAVSGETTIVGAREDDNGSSVDQGSAYIFVRNGATWTQQQKLTASDGAADDLFGTSVAISGETAIVGALLDNIGSSVDQGSAYIFVRNGTTWTQQQKLVAADGAADDVFGTSVAISGETAIVGASDDDNGSSVDQGSAYVFVRSGATWTQQQKLMAADAATEDLFGTSVAISSGTAIVGASDDAIGSTNFQGSAYIFNTTAPTAASVSIAGRVFAPSGRGLMNATVILTDTNGIIRTTRTMTFGYYRFDDVMAGETYILSVRSKNYSFTPQVVTATEDLTDLNFTAHPKPIQNLLD